MSIPQFQHLRVTAPRIGCVCLPLWLIDTKDQGIAVALTRVRTLPASPPAASPQSSSLSLRTGHSPQVALHPSSRKRSYHRIRGGNVTPEGTFTLLFKRLQRRTSAGVLARTGLGVCASVFDALAFETVKDEIVVVELTRGFCGRGRPRSIKPSVS